MPSKPAKISNHSIGEVQSKISQILEDLAKHPSVDVMNEILDPNHQLFNEVRFKFTTFFAIHLSFKIGLKYKVTNDLAKEIRQMCLIKHKLNLTN